MYSSTQTQISPFPTINGPSPFGVDLHEEVKCAIFGRERERERETHKSDAAETTHPLTPWPRLREQAIEVPAWHEIEPCADNYVARYLGMDVQATVSALSNGLEDGARESVVWLPWVWDLSPFPFVSMEYRPRAVPAFAGWSTRSSKAKSEGLKAPAQSRLLVSAHLVRSSTSSISTKSRVDPDPASQRTPGKIGCNSFLTIQLAWRGSESRVHCPLDETLVIWTELRGRREPTNPGESSCWCKLEIIWASSLHL